MKIEVFKLDTRGIRAFIPGKYTSVIEQIVSSW